MTEKILLCLGYLNRYLGPFCQDCVNYLIFQRRILTHRKILQLNFIKQSITYTVDLHLLSLAASNLSDIQLQVTNSLDHHDMASQLGDLYLSHYQSAIELFQITR